MSWSKKYKKSIDCSNPKGFSQKAHCAGRKARQSGNTTKSKSVNEMKISDLKEQIRSVIRERSVKAIQKEYQKVIDDMQSHLDMYKKSKGTPNEKKHIDALKTLTTQKKKLQSELDSAVAGLYKNAELKVDESVQEASTSSAPGEWVAYLSMTRGKMLLKTFDSARGAKQYLSKNKNKLLGLPHVESVGIMTKKQWDEREAKYAIEGVSEAKYPTDLKIGSVVMGQGFTRLKGIDGGKYYKIVAMDDTTATLVPSDKNGNVKGSSKVRHKLDSIEGGIKTAKRGDENGIVVIKESVNEGKLGDTWRKNNKKGYVLKVGNIELKSAGPSNSHDIYKNGYLWGTFAMDYEAGGNDWWVKPGKGQDFWVDSIDDLVKRVKTDSRFK